MLEGCKDRGPRTPVYPLAIAPTQFEVSRDAQATLVANRSDNDESQSDGLNSRRERHGETAPRYPPTRFRALALFGRRPPQPRGQIIVAGVRKPAQEQTLRSN